MDVGQPYRFIGNELYADNGLGLYDFKARLYDPATGRFLSVDPLAEKNYSVSPYAYCNNNPLILVDKDGKLPDFIWDVANVVMDVKSLVTNVATGNIGGAIVDGIGLVVDVASAAVPGVPGGAGTVIKSVRNSSRAVDGLKAVGKTANITDDVVDVTKASRYAKLRESATTGQEAHRQIEKFFMESGEAIDKEVVVSLSNGSSVRKDALLKDGSYLIIKPDTPSGHYSATKRESLMHQYGYQTKTVFYDPKNPAYQPGSSTYIGPKTK